MASRFISVASRAIDIWRLIQGSPFTVAFKTTAGVTLSAQTIRLEYDKAVVDATSEAGRGYERKLVLFGVRDHPLKTTTVPDTVMAKGYRFTYANREYTVLDPILEPGEIQARAEAVG